ncbi:hypothetical protein PHYBOEH_001714 [Phytophthora boehmeriae]|uniref:EamA domain-containing protein n=1 Tax=Phytophthora boehmeriae TaxID=109152 RepID=A0A8T1WTK5_9STRA|nr:hypothetical protein PHYBOEH_001714 [Phytophthora boehmeriae]
MVALLPLLIGYYKFFGSSADRYANSISVLENHSVIPLPKLLHMSAMLSIFYLVAEYFWYAAITNMSVAVGTAIYNCSPLFVYCLSVCFLHEQLSFKKAFGMLTSLLGVMLVIMFQDGSNVDSIEGTSIVAGLLMVVSAALYAGYQVSLRLMVGEDFTHSPTLLMLAGFCGLFTIPPWILGSFLMAESPFPLLYESLGLPGTGEGIVLLVLCGILMVVFCAFQPLAICWTSPLETSVGCMLMLPVSGIMDTMVHHTVFSWQCIVGSLLVMGGFVILEARKKKSMPKPQDSDVTFSPCA